MRRWRRDRQTGGAQEGGGALQRQTDGVGIAAGEGCHKGTPTALNGVGTGLVKRFVGGQIGIDVVFCEGAKDHLGAHRLEAL
jgi:hypothetical protein